MTTPLSKARCHAHPDLRSRRGSLAGGTPARGWALFSSTALALVLVTAVPEEARAQDAAARAREAAAAASRAADEAESAAAAAREAAERKDRASRPAPAPEPAATAETPAEPAATAGPPDELTRQAIEAARLAAEAAARATGLAERAMDRADQAEGKAPPAAASAQAASSPSGPELEQAIQSAEEAAAAAREAARAARAAARELEEQQRLRFARRALTVGVFGFYAPEDIDAANGVNVQSSQGASATVGWRIHPHVALEARGDWFDGFDYQSKKVEGKVDGFAVTGNIKVFPLIGRFQPYFVTGFGAINAEVKQRRFSNDQRATDQHTEVTGRVGAGLDLMLSDAIALEVEATYNGSGGDLDYLDYGLLSAGLQFRFY
jgi:opacity protein-like surface antigen